MFVVDISEIWRFEPAKPKLFQSVNNKKNSSSSQNDQYK